MASRKHQKSRNPLSVVKLSSIKQECYAIASVETTKLLKAKYKTLCKGHDFRKRTSWEYLLKRLRDDGDWSGLRISDLETFADSPIKTMARALKPMTFHPGRVEMDRAAENDD